MSNRERVKKDSNMTPLVGAWQQILGAWQQIQSGADPGAAAVMMPYIGNIEVVMMPYIGNIEVGMAVGVITIEPDADRIAYDAELEGRHEEAMKIRQAYAIEPTIYPASEGCPVFGVVSAIHDGNRASVVVNLKP